MSVLLAVLIIGLIIFVHELGHFLFAKKNGVKVIEFSIGFGPRLFTFVKGETRYSLKIIPFGGSCHMLGYDEEDLESERAYNSKSVYTRMSISFAGPLFNFIFAFILAMILIGFVGYDLAKVVNIQSNSPAAEAGLKEGDIITKFNGSNVDVSRDISIEMFINPLDKKPIDISYIRDGKEYETTITPVLTKRYMFGIEYSDDSSKKVTLTNVVKDSPFEKAGFKIDDILLEINNVELNNYQDLISYLTKNPLTQEEVLIKYERNGDIKEIMVTPELNASYYNMGFYYSTNREKTDALGVIKYSFIELKYQVKTTIKSVGMLITGKLTANDLSGPVGIADIVNKTYEASKPEGIFTVFLSMLELALLISANLGVMNLLPIPALDGGKLIFLIIEAVRRKPIAKEKEGAIQLVGMALLLILAVFVLFNDIKKLFM